MRHPRVRAAWLSFFWGVVLFYFLFCALVLTTRWILLPQVDRYKDEIAGFLSDKLHAEVSIGSVSPRWDTFWPQLSMDNVVIRRPDPRTSDEHVLHLPQVYASFYWRSILGQPIFRRLEVTDAEITVRRVGENVFDLAGFVFDFDRSAGEGGGGGLEWLLKQGRIDLVNTRLTYSDLIAQPRPRHTSLENINLSFAQEGGEYKAGIQGNLRSLHDNRIDVRVRFTTPLFGERTWDTWTGELFVAADNLDIARLARPIPSARKLIGSGRGSTRTWLTFDEGKPKELTSYLGMSDVVLRFTEEAEPLRVKTLSTLLTETFENDVISAKAENLAFELPDGTSARDLELTSTVALTDAASPDSPRSGFTIRHLDVGTLEKLLPSVPFPKEAVELIAEHHAGGNITDFELTWSGKPREARDWRIRAGFENLSLANAAGAQNMFSGFENLTGSLEITRESGHIAFDTRSGAVSLPGVFENARVPLDELTGTVSWNRAVDPTLSKPVVTVSFDNVAVSNEDAAVTLKGLWRQNDTKAGYIDISGNLLRGKAESAWRYIPLKIHQNVRNWLQGGLVAGTATDGNYVLKGDLVHYPWTGEYKDKGLFRVEAKLTGGAIDYVPSLRVLRAPSLAGPRSRRPAPKSRTWPGTKTRACWSWARRRPTCKSSSTMSKPAPSPGTFRAPLRAPRPRGSGTWTCRLTFPCCTPRTPRSTAPSALRTPTSRWPGRGRPLPTSKAPCTFRKRGRARATCTPEPSARATRPCRCTPPRKAPSSSAPRARPTPRTSAGLPTTPTPTPCWKTSREPCPMWSRS